MTFVTAQGRLHNLHVSLVPSEDDLVEEADGTRRRRGSNLTTQEEKDIGVSVLLQDLKIPEHGSKVPSSKAPAAAMEESPMSTGL